MDIVSLKARAYDILAEIDYLRGQLAQVNHKIAELSKPQPKVEVKSTNDTGA